MARTLPEVGDLLLVGEPVEGPDALAGLVARMFETCVSKVLLVTSVPGRYGYGVGVEVVGEPADSAAEMVIPDDLFGKGFFRKLVAGPPI